MSFLSRHVVWCFFCLFILSSCLSTNPVIVEEPASKGGAEAGIEETSLNTPPEISDIPEPEDSIRPDTPTSDMLAKEDPHQGEGNDIPAPEEEKDTVVAPAPTPELTNQELLDFTLNYCEISDEFWERGDLEKALEACDKAYAYVLKVNGLDDPEVLQQKEDLRFTISKRIIEIYASRFTAVNGIHKEIPLDMNRHVEKALSLFKGRERSFFLDSYRRSGRYRPAIVEALEEAGLPTELSWLPLIESGYKVRALSRARALGLWQFIASTGYKFGLKRDRWIDERMDPEKSTQAAILYLKELHQIFGDWTTVLAAYNCGERRVLDKIKTQRINYLDNFWDLYERLPRETAFYVPRFLAVLHIINDPEAHGFQLPPVDEVIPSEKVTINKQVHLQTISKRIHVDYRSLLNMNAELRQNLTPPDPYSLKVPLGKSEILLAELDDIPIWRPPTPTYVVHKVRRGDTLSVIAHKYHSSIRSIMAYNGLRRSGYLKVGWKLKIPTKRGAAPPPPRQRGTQEVKKGALLQYTVQKGDSLWDIAKRFHTTANTIITINQLKTSTLQVGQVLLISSGKSSPGGVTTAQYKVRRGDSPYLIAKRYRMSLAAFLEMNNLTSRSTIFPGQTVIVAVR
jgi:membrane-bound lytic murein transglycosylase D